MIEHNDTTRHDNESCSRIHDTYIHDHLSKPGTNNEIHEDDIILKDKGLYVYKRHGQRDRDEDGSR